MREFGGEKFRVRRTGAAVAIAEGVDGHAERLSDFQQATGVDVPIVLFRWLLKHGIEHFSEVALRQPDLEPRCLHKSVDVSIGRVARHRPVLLARPVVFRTTHWCDDVTKPANTLINSPECAIMFIKDRIPLILPRSILARESAGAQSRDDRL
jgi:hypothetical protein